MMLRSAVALLVSSLFATAAQAGAVTFESSPLLGSFSVSHTLNLSQNSRVDGLLSTMSSQSDDVRIESVLLSQGGQSFRFDQAADLDQLLHLGQSSQQIGQFMGRPLMGYLDQYSLSNILLSAGTWQLTVNGLDRNDKAIGSYRLALNTHAVPEPQSLALALSALGALALLRRRQVSKNHSA